MKVAVDGAVCSACPPRPRPHLTPWWQSTTVGFAMSRSSVMVSDHLRRRVGTEVCVCGGGDWCCR
jgi:hypothetical protein